MPLPPGSIAPQNATKNTEVDYGADTLIEYDGYNAAAPDEDEEAEYLAGDETCDGDEMDMEQEGPTKGRQSIEGHVKHEDIDMDEDETVSKGELLVGICVQSVRNS